jgi:hypothetical protein
MDGCVVSKRWLFFFDLFCCDKKSSVEKQEGSFKD